MEESSEQGLGLTPIVLLALCLAVDLSAQFPALDAHRPVGRT